MSKIRLPYPHAGQRIVRREAKRFNILSAGRRWRKTTLVMAISIESAVETGAVLWGAPTYDQVTVGWEETKRAGKGVIDFNQSRMTATMPNGGRIVYRSLDDPDNARGFTARGVVIDESGDVKSTAWYEVLRQMLIDTFGWAWLIGTPKGQNWFYHESVKALDHANYAAWQAPTLGVEITEDGLIRRPHALENPHIAFEEILDLYRTSPERAFRQEIMAEFIEDAGGVFRLVKEAVDKGRTENEAANTNHSYSMGVDLARVEDFTVLCVVDENGRQVYFERFNQISWERQIESIKRVARAFDAKVVIDSTGVGDPVLEACRKAGLKVTPFQFTNSSKEQLIDNLAMRIEQGQARLMDIPEQTGELQAYQYELTPSRNVRMNAPAGMHDDTVIALALAVWSISKRQAAPAPQSQPAKRRYY